METTTKKSFTFYRSFRDCLRKKPAKLRLEVLETIINYALDGEIPGRFSDDAESLFTLIKPLLDSNTQKAKGAIHGALGGRPKQENKNPMGYENKNPMGYPQEQKVETLSPIKNKDKEINKDIEKENIKEKRFVKPTVKEVMEYCKERRNNVDPETFVNFYESKGWKVGSNPMKDWKAAVRTWEQSRSKAKIKTPSTFVDLPTMEDYINDGGFQV